MSTSRFYLLRGGEEIRNSAGAKRKRFWLMNHVRPPNILRVRIVLSRKRRDTARLWTDLTAAAVGPAALASLPATVPDHAYFPLYGPDFRMATRKKMLPDRNDEVYLDRCVRALPRHACVVPNEIQKHQLRRIFVLPKRKHRRFVRVRCTHSCFCLAEI